MIANAQKDQAIVIAKLKLENVISIVPPIDFMEATFNSTFDYDNPFGLELKDVWGNHTSPFVVSSNRNFNVTIQAGSASFLYIGPSITNNNMPCSVLSYNLASNGTGGSNGTSSTWVTLDDESAPLINGGTPGPHKPFALKFKAKPGWEFAAGTYVLDVVVTACQF